MKDYYHLFRQDRETILERLQPFLDHFQGLQPVADIGCGRGEFCELLAKGGLEYVGIDDDPQMVALCSQMGLQVRESGLFAFLEAAKGYGGLFASHVIEHLDAHSAERMIALGHEALSSGGRLILVTPNPENIEVMTKGFWLDLTHVRPYPLALLEAMLQEQGFRIVASGDAPGTAGRIRFMALRRALARALLPWVGLRPFWDYLYVAQDIFVVAEKD